MFKWYNNVVATNIADWNILFVTLCDADFSVIFKNLKFLSCWCYLTQTTPKFYEYSDRDSDKQTEQ